MILLLDAHAILWAVSQPGSLADDARSAIESPSNDVLVSAGSIWELEIKRASPRPKDQAAVPLLEAVLRRRSS